MSGLMLLHMVLLILHVNNMLLMTGLLHQDPCKFAKTAHGHHAMQLISGIQLSAKQVAGLLLQTGCTMSQATTVLSEKIKCRENFSKMDQWNVQSKLLITSRNIQEESIQKSCLTQLILTILLLSLVGVKIKHQAKTTGLEEIHGVHIGVKVVSSK